jgi:hypothetical protein
MGHSCWWSCNLNWYPYLDQSQTKIRVIFYIKKSTTKHKFFSKITPINQQTTKQAIHKLQRSFNKADWASHFIAKEVKTQMDFACVPQVDWSHVVSNH